MTSRRRYLNLGDIAIHDEFWCQYTRLVADVIVPYQWDILNDNVPEVPQSHCIDNFRIAAKEQEGDHYGVVFQDSDLYKWLETTSYCIHNNTGKEYEKLADEVIEIVGRAQQSDGYLNTYYTIKEPNARFTNLIEGHELYCAGHLIEAAVAYYRATNKRKLLDIAERFAKLIVKEFGPGKGQKHGYPGHQEIELALIKLYYVTGDRSYIECAKYFIDVRGTKPNYFEEELRQNKTRIFHEFENYDLKYSQAHIPPVEQRSIEGHAVRAMYMCSAMVELAYEFEDKPLMNACDALWDNLISKRMYITGGIGSSGILERFTTDYDLPNDRNYSETCASIGLMMFGQRMSFVKKNAIYYEIIERALYNTVLAGINTKGDRYFYVNPLEVWPDNCMNRTSLEHVKPVRQPWFRVACCPTNVARTLASLGQYIYSTDEEGLYINLFISSSIDFELNGNHISIHMNSNFMSTGKIKFNVTATKNTPFTIGIRIPTYFESYIMKLNKKPINIPIKDGYVYMNEEWIGNSVIELEAFIPTKFVMANKEVRADVGKVALVKGPCVYCLEEVDNGDNLSLIYVDRITNVEEYFDENLSLYLPALTYEGKRLQYENWEVENLYQSVELSKEQVRLKAIPYGLWCNRIPGEMLVWQKALV